MTLNKIFIFGIDRAGKTVISNYLSKGVIDNNTKPTLAFQTQQLIHPKIKGLIFDAPGQIKLRNLWIDNVKESKVLIFVLDTADSARFNESKNELLTFLKKLHNNYASLLFVFHKMDIPEAQANLTKAKAVFDLEKIFKPLDMENVERVQISTIETNIKDIKTLDALRDKIYDLFVKFDLEESKRKASGK